MIIFHAGLHKTGSSAIQEALTMTSRTGQVLNAGWPSGFLHQRKFSPQWISKAKKAATRKTIVISSEELFGSVLDGYPRADQTAQYLSESFGDVDLRIVVYIRPQIEWVESIFTQTVQGGELLDPSAVVARMLSSQNVRFSHLVWSLHNRVGSKVLVVRPMGSGVNVVSDFYRHLDLGTPPTASSRRPVNRSATALQVYALRRLFEESDTSQRLRLVHFFQGMISPRPEASQTSVLTREDQEMLIELTQKDATELFSFLDETTEERDPTFESVWAASRRFSIPFAGSYELEDDVRREIEWSLQFMLDKLPDPWSSRTSERLVHKLLHERSDIPGAVARASKRATSRTLGASWR